VRAQRRRNPFLLSIYIELDAREKKAAVLFQALECLNPLSHILQEIQKLKQRILKEEQQLRAVSGPAYVAKNRDRASTEQSVSKENCTKMFLPWLLSWMSLNV
jgi:hypothetical protein